MRMQSKWRQVQPLVPNLKGDSDWSLLDLATGINQEFFLDAPKRYDPDLRVHCQWNNCHEAGFESLDAFYAHCISHYSKTLARQHIKADITHILGNVSILLSGQLSIISIAFVVSPAHLFILWQH